MKKFPALLVFFVLLLGCSRVFAGVPAYYIYAGSYFTSGQAAIAAMGSEYAWVPFGAACGTGTCSNPNFTYGGCGHKQSNMSCIGVNRQTATYSCGTKKMQVTTGGALYCSAVVGVCNAGTELVDYGEGTQVCVPSCTSPNIAGVSGGFAVCNAPPCTAGEIVAGHGSDTLAKCKGGCSYTITAPTVSFFATTGAISGVHSRWSNTGATCTGGDTLVAGGSCSEMTSGVTGGDDPNYRMIYCGIQSPCPDGTFAFSGLCANDTEEDGCVVIDGESVCAEADQNCVIVDGKRVCAELPDEAANELYKDNGCVWSLAAGEWVCPTSTAKTEKTSTTTSVTDPVTGNTTKTTVTTQKDNLLPGLTTTTTTTVYDAEGNELSSESVSSSTGSGGQAAALVSRAATALGEVEDLDWLRTYEEVKDSLSAQWDGLEVVQAVKSFQNLSLTAVEGVCPEFCLPLFGETLCTTAHCEIWAQISFIIQGVLLALYGMAAIRIVLSA